ncbi:Initiation-specific alpha-1,6-mannosyltransferase [Taphrina deformans PYCC 5710]|uniref:Initiation-specific alpha-1,6-mannosyltransferase n=1 Tax=Taphrina deformans (strain PYCC 5710 / ATCC 11124 / CBS 356.35 / IMI 108563 / JCM 9778 / NBRC 8474) TaxID=1097556 RepID=R4XI76_TAPDE|nr:Initiation-specific alpha-1,6-mannosyltransferase [Taphrina deformans PYCC 5710]|eukprot:CCG83092.1 Initiation-specific alpha-1,6-mannosyltransferase [Taphrina deformans PYCC 5710]
MHGRSARLVLLTVLALLGLFYLFSTRHVHSVHDIIEYQQNTKAALNALKCSIDPQDPSCDDAGQGTSTSEHVVDDGDTPEQTGIGHLDYPQGFQQFDTSSPNSPYNQGTYGTIDSEDSEGHPVTDEGATYMQRLQAWVPYNLKYNTESHNPVIWQTYQEEPNTNSIPYASWLEKNKPKWSRTFMAQADTSDAIDRISRDLEFLNETYQALPARVLQTDLLRYVTLFKNGGVYADIDTNCYAGIESWYAQCYTESTSIVHGDRVRASQPGLIVGVEFDLERDPNFEHIDGRQVALANYVFAANKGHPVLARVIDRIVTRTLNSSHPPAFDLSNHTHTYEWTGRKVWTDTIVAHIQSTVRGFRERDLLGLKKARVFDDICVLPIRAFGSGQSKYKNSPDSESEGVLVSPAAQAERVERVPVLTEP